MVRHGSTLWHGLVGHEVKVSMTYISWSSDFTLYLEDYLMYVHHTFGVWIGMTHHSTSKLMWVTIFHGPVIEPYTLKTISCMNIIIWDYESVWPDAWPQNKCRSLWPIFHGPMILCYILKTIYCMNIILGDYGSVWPDVWPHNILMRYENAKFEILNKRPNLIWQSIMCFNVHPLHNFDHLFFFNKIHIRFVLSAMTSQKVLRFATEKHASCLA